MKKEITLTKENKEEVSKLLQEAINSFSYNDISSLYMCKKGGDIIENLKSPSCRHLKRDNIIVKSSSDNVIFYNKEGEGHIVVLDTNNIVITIEDNIIIITEQESKDSEYDESILTFRAVDATKY